MSDIPPINETPGPARAASTRQTSPARTTTVAEPGDTLEISDSGRALSTVDPAEGVRVDKVLAIREAILAGRYDVEEKIDATVDRLLGVLRGDH
jgi:anti-sigma28 factor (negative regulator of flagellin synthesis)